MDPSKFFLVILCDRRNQTIKAGIKELGDCFCRGQNYGSKTK